MAELSPETNAIIERLRAEGDLVRNSGTNSIRSVKIQLDRFDGLFTSIQANVSEQTQMLRTQLGIQEAKFEAESRQRDFDNLKKEQEANDADARADRDRKSAEERDAKMIDALSGMMSLKNLALGAAGGFLGYNLLKGAIDEQFNGAFSNMEQGLANFDPAKITEMMDNFSTTMSSLNTTIDNLNATIAGIEADFEKFKEYLSSAAFALDILGKVISAVAIYKTLRLLDNRGLLPDLKNRRTGPTAGMVEEGRGSAYDQYGKDVEKRQAAAEAARQAEIERQRQIETERMNRAQRNAQVKVTDTGPRIVTDAPSRLATPDLGPGSSGMGTGTGFTNTRFGSGAPSNLNAAPGAGSAPVVDLNSYRPRPVGMDQFNRRVQNATAAMDPDAPLTASRLRQLLNDANNKIPDRWKRAITKLFDFLAKANIAFKVVDTIIIINAISQGGTDEEIAARLAQALGGIVGGALGTIAGAWAGVAGGPFAWVTVPAGGLLGGYLGSLGGDWIAYKLVMWALGETPPNAEIQKIQEGIDAQLKMFADENAAMNQPLVPFISADASSLDSIYPQFGGQAAQAQYNAQQMAAASRAAIANGTQRTDTIGMGEFTGSTVLNSQLSSSRASGIVAIRPGQETNALDAIAEAALNNGTVVVIKGGDTTVAPNVVTSGGNISVEAATVVGSHMNRNMNVYASGPFPGVVYDE